MKPSKEVILKSGSVYLGVVAVLCCIEIIWACGKDDAAEKPSRDVCGSLSEMHGTLVCSHLISDKNTRVALTVRPGGFDKIALTKYVMTADDTLRVPLSFMNANIHPLHYDFLIDAFPEVFDGVSPVQYLRMATNGDTRSLIVGDIALYIEGGKTFYGFTILDDSANPKKVIRHNQAQHLYRELSSSFTIGELTFVPNTSAQIQATKSWPADIPIVGLEEIEYEVYTIGEGFGTVRILDPYEFQTASASGEIGFQDILVLDEAPIDLERIVSGTVTGIRDAEVDENLLDSLKRLILEIFKSDTVMVRFRSSSNAEDAISFSGAGLYDSESACLADETDGDTIGPSHCDSDQRNERELSRALKKVWASLWNPTAYEERSWYGVDHLQTAMGILVNTRTKNEAANIVAFTGNPVTGESDYLINAQLGELDVVSSDPGIYPETTLLKMNGREVAEIRRMSASSEAALGVTVLTDELLKEIGVHLTNITSVYPLDAEVPVERTLFFDTEWKLIENKSLIIKQIRPFLY